MTAAAIAERLVEIAALVYNRLIITSVITVKDYKSRTMIHRLIVYNNHVRHKLYSRKLQPGRILKKLLNNYKIIWNRI